MHPTEEMQHVHDHYDALGRALAEVLNHRNIQGGGWTHEASWNIHGSVSLSHPAELGFLLHRTNTHRRGDAGRRLTIDGVYPSCWGGPRAASITVGMNRPVPRIADEIVRRLLPDYLTTVQEALAQLRVDEEHRRARAAMNRRMEAILPGLGSAGGPRHPEPDRTRSYWHGGRYGLRPRSAVASGSVALNADASHMDMKLSGVPADLALTILALLASTPVPEGTVAAGTLPAERKTLPSVSRAVCGEGISKSPAGRQHAGATLSIDADSAARAHPA
ncbi:hypothetical protein ACGRHY_28025 [Streptomyces sp. HK10]|uniref:hypothetical protein n=1 Tax=Streptomyces sp. HK10 TaxID=3373255 RepID=UPI0037488E4A